MGGGTLKVPAEYVDTLRGAVVSDVDFWNDAAKNDVAEIAEARAREDEGHARFREGDLGDHQRLVAEAAGLVAQLPAPGTKVDAEITARSDSLASLAEEAARECIKGLAREMDYSPIAPDSLRPKIEQLGWWVSEYERHEAARSADAEASTAEVA